MRSSPYSALFFDRSWASFSSSATEETPHIYGRRIFAAVHRFNRHQHAHLWGDLNHACVSRQARSRLVQSSETAAFHWVRILPPLADSNSMMHSGRVAAPLP